MKKKAYVISALVVLIVGVAVVLILSHPGVKNPQNSVVVASWGGAFQKAQDKAFFQPFQSKTGVKVIQTYTPPYGKITEMVRDGNPTIDLIDVESFFVSQATREGILQPLDFSQIDTADLIKGDYTKYGIGTVTWATVLGYNKEMLKQAPTSWKDLWSTKEFPGPRALRDDPMSSLEIALLADGVPPDSLYPLDVNRAFRKLSELRKKTKLILWSSGDEARQLLVNKSVSMLAGWNGRLYAAIEDGKPVGICWNNEILEMDWWVIPKGAKNAANAMKLLAFSLQPDQQADQSKYITYGPANLKAIPIIESELPLSYREYLPTYPKNMKNAIVLSQQWWSEHYTEVLKRWEAWKLKGE